VNHPVFTSRNIIGYKTVITANFYADDPIYLLCLRLICIAIGMYKLRKRGLNYVYGDSE